MERAIIQILKIHFYLHKEDYSNSFSESHFEDVDEDEDDDSSDFIVNVNWILIEGQEVHQENNICNEYYASKIKKYCDVNDIHFEKLFSLFENFILEK
jgi:hypothetical protein